ncbi:MAG: T9SS type A sorting domain-containing protein [Lewinellaceae bacterium]|nr:T9SS type A sorting domain-containing protein [Saprospiraceae bacterium]MCB9312684.1 T9SS type A sorting domain-containing protein [Lewinellaceae bacterium]
MKQFCSILLVLTGMFSLHAQQPELVKNIRPGSNGSLPYYENGMISYNDHLLFAADDGVSGMELWISDGTETGTMLLKDINPGAAGSECQNFFRVGEKVIFQAKTTAEGQELWVTDGTAAGTTLLKDIRPGTGDGVWITVAVNDYYYVWNDVLYFSANDGQVGLELWRTDGTESGTWLLKDIQTIFGANGNGNPRYFGELGDKLYFTGYENSSDGEQLWVTDGTTAGTKRFHTFPGVTGGVNPRHKLAVNGRLVFYAEGNDMGPELWATDGTPAGTLLVKDINPAPNTGSDDTQPNTHEHRLNRIGNTIYFGANDGTNGRELWRTDGTPAGTWMVKDGSAKTPGYVPQLFTVMDDILYYKYDNGENGIELWRSDGTEAGTWMVKDATPGSQGSFWLPSFLTAINGRIYFGGAKGSAFNVELWTSDGTEAGTMVLPDINPSSGDGSDPNRFTLVGDEVLFGARTATQGMELWKIKASSVSTSDPVLEGVSLFPTMTTGSFTLQGDDQGGYDLRVLDLQGRWIAAWSNQPAGRSYDLASAAPGMYLVQISREGHSALVKLVLEH